MPAIPCSLIRGGTSRGAYFFAHDLPPTAPERDAILTRLLGGPDPLQVDGIGGGHPLTSKVAIIRPSQEPGVDVDYLFLQVDPREHTVSSAQNCGNLLAGVGVFVIEHGLVEVSSPCTYVTVRMLNSAGLCRLTLPTPQGLWQSEGKTQIDGVPGSAAPITCTYLDIAGSTCGALLPTGLPVNQIEGIEVTCVDNGMPVVVMRATDLGVTGTESPAALNTNESLKSCLEQIRLQAGYLMNLGDVTALSVPKMCLVSAPLNGGLINTRTFIPKICHETIGVLGAVSVASACLLPGTPAASLACVPKGSPAVANVEHPGGSFPLSLQLDDQGNILEVGVIRTARLLFQGWVYH